MAVNIDLVKELREITGLSFGQINKALIETGGDKAKSLEILKANGAIIAEKKSERSTSEGTIASYIHSNKKVASLVELLCETDFVARNPIFVELAYEIAMQVSAMAPKDTEELLAQPYIKDPSRTIKELINENLAKLGENIRLGKFIRFNI